MSTTAAPRRAGRPALGDNVSRLPLYGDVEDMRRVTELAERWELSKSAAVRRAIQLASERGRGDESALTDYLIENSVLTEEACKRLARGVLRVLGLR